MVVETDQVDRRLEPSEQQAESGRFRFDFPLHNECCSVRSPPRISKSQSAEDSGRYNNRIVMCAAAAHLHPPAHSPPTAQLSAKDSASVRAGQRTPQPGRPADPITTTSAPGE